MKKTALLLAALLFAGSGLAQETKRVNVETRRVDGSSSIGAFSDIPAPGTCPDGYVPYFGGTPPVLICGATVYAPTTKTLSVPYGALQAANVTATALPTPGAITVTPVYTQVASITVVAGASLVDGDGFIVRGTGASVLPLEFDATPGNGTSGGAVPLIFAPGDSATVIRDLVITTINGATATTHVVATAGGAATVSLAIDAPGVAGGARLSRRTRAPLLGKGTEVKTHTLEREETLCSRASERVRQEIRAR